MVHYLKEASELKEQRNDLYENLFHFPAFNARIVTLFEQEERLQILIRVSPKAWICGQKNSEAGGTINVHPSCYSAGLMCDLSISEDACMGVIRYLREKGYFVEVVRMSIDSVILRVSLEEIK